MSLPTSRRRPSFRLPAGAAAALLPAAAARAHEGHGMPALHWHASDVWGFVAVGVLLMVALWAGRR